MTLAITYSRACIGIQSPIVTVETHLSKGLPALSMVGLPETVVKESKDRVRSALLNSGFEFPDGRITINLAPAELRKEGGRFDLAIAIGILAASKQIPNKSLSSFEFAGELALSGELRPIQGMLSFGIATKNEGRTLIISHQNAAEAALIKDLAILPANHLLEVSAHLLGRTPLQEYVPQAEIHPTFEYPDLNQVKGQHQAKRALEIAAAGQHSVLFMGPPGIGKTMISHCLPGILPCMPDEEALELAAIQSIYRNKLNTSSWRKRPFRTPHHSASSYALIGGGNPPKPGEISLAHNGVLFLDELPEFKRQTLESLREPLESGSITLSRAGNQIQYPAKFQLIAAMNPCPCGHLNNTQANCHCTSEQIKKYQNRISGPLLDRIDLQLELQPLSSSFLNAHPDGESSAVVAQRVLKARRIQLERCNKYNALLTNNEMQTFCNVDEPGRDYLQRAIEHMKLSPRSYTKILKIARTLADLEEYSSIDLKHIQEAILYRSLERKK